MTIPQLSNCPHSESGWCLDCVKSSHEEYEKSLEKLRKHYEDGLDSIEMKLCNSYEAGYGYDIDISGISGTIYKLRT